MLNQRFPSSSGNLEAASQFRNDWVLVQFKEALQHFGIYQPSLKPRLDVLRVTQIRQPTLDQIT
jgi:hypothetical protein